MLRPLFFVKEVFKLNKKILVLCSGGFDSVLLLKYVKDCNPDATISTLFFNYGQKSLEQERRCSKSISHELGCSFHEVTLPKFSWTSGDFYKEGFSGDGEYLEMRNLVFFSYALSISESREYSEVFAAILKSLGYYDTSDAFLSKVKSLFADKGVTFSTPFSDMCKDDLAPLAFKYSMKKEEFFSCDNPVNGLPCGKCPDCEAIEDILEYASPNTAAKVWAKTFNPYSEDFQRLFKKSPIHEMRVLVNNDCQLKCKHCYYGFDNMKQPRLSLEEFQRVFVEARDLGINDFHFSGKEPLYDEFIFDVTRSLREVHPSSDCTVVTNGINVPKYADLLKEHRFSKVFLSVDDVQDSSFFRSVTHVTDRALEALNKVGIPVEVFIDLHQNNFNKVNSIMSFLYDSYGVRDFYVRTITLVGSASDMTPLSTKELDVSFQDIKSFTDLHPGCRANLTLTAPYVYDMLCGSEHETSLAHTVRSIISTATLYVSRNFSVFPEMYCGKYESQVTLTPDGYIHGCASEMSTDRYDEVSPGNVRDHSLSSLIDRGKNLCIRSNCKEVDSEGRVNFFSCSCTNLLD